MTLSKRRTLTVWSVIFALSLAWSFLVPLRGQSDESAHAAHAAAVVRGQPLLSGEFVREKEKKVQSRRIEVWVPANFSDANTGAACMFWKPDVAESCASPIPDSHGKEASVFTPAANYPPAYYAAVGWPSLFLDGAAAWYGMRILTALLCSLAVTMGLACLARTFGIRTALATLVALTPTSLSFFGTINPQGPEIALAFAMACLMAPLACGHRPSNGHLAALGAVAGLLTVIRPSSALWTVIIGLIFFICIRAPMWNYLSKRPAFYGCLGVVTVAGIIAIVWNNVAKPGDNALGWPEPDMSFARMMEKLSEAVGDYWGQAFGNFGWESNPVPEGFGWAFLAVCAVLAVAALILGNRVQRIAVVVGVAIVPVSTILMQFFMLPQTGIIWQGRYNLPVIAAVMVLCVVVVCRRLGTWASAPLLFIFVYFTLIWALRTSHRYATGLNVAYEISDVPFDHIVAMLMAVACAVGLGSLYRRGTSRVYGRAYVDAAVGGGARAVAANLAVGGAGSAAVGAGATAGAGAVREVGGAAGVAGGAAGAARAGAGGAGAAGGDARPAAGGAARAVAGAKRVADSWRGRFGKHAEAGQRAAGTEGLADAKPGGGAQPDVGENPPAGSKQAGAGREADADDGTTNKGGAGEEASATSAAEDAARAGKGARDAGGAGRDGAAQGGQASRGDTGGEVDDAAGPELASPEAAGQDAGGEGQSGSDQPQAPSQNGARSRAQRNWSRLSARRRR